MTNEDLIAIQNLVTSSRRLLILTGKNPSIDAMASALALYLASIKLGKDATIAMETDPLVELANLVGIDQVKKDIGGKNLVVTYRPYSLGDFEKVSYLEDQAKSDGVTDSFKLTITPRDSFTPDAKNFSYSYSGGAFDLIFTIDVLEPTLLGQLYSQELFNSTPIINIDNHDPNKDYGRFNLVEPDAASISEIVTFFLRAVNAQLDNDIAGNLYQGLVFATNNFQSEKVAAATFEAAAILLRAGAKQKTPTPQPILKPNPIMQTQPIPSQQNPTQQTRPIVSQQQNNQRSGPNWGSQPKVYRGTSTV